MVLSKDRIYTVDDINALPEGTTAELIDGQIFMQASPSRTHQRISGKLFNEIANYINAGQGVCEVYTAPFDIFINGDESECLIPDISVICKPDIIRETGCYGAPDWIIEITSPSTASRDYLIKSVKYQAAGVREYWVVNPKTQAITVYCFGNGDFAPQVYTFKDSLKVNIYDGFSIDFSKFCI